MLENSRSPEPEFCWGVSTSSFTQSTDSAVVHPLLSWQPEAPVGYGGVGDGVGDSVTSVALWLGLSYAAVSSPPEHPAVNRPAKVSAATTDGADRFVMTACRTLFGICAPTPG